MSVIREDLLSIVDGEDKRDRSQPPPDDYTTEYHDLSHDESDAVLVEFDESHTPLEEDAVEYHGLFDNELDAVMVELHEPLPTFVDDANEYHDLSHAELDASMDDRDGSQPPSDDNAVKLPAPPPDELAAATNERDEIQPPSDDNTIERISLPGDKIDAALDENHPWKSFPLALHEVPEHTTITCTLTRAEVMRRHGHVLQGIDGLLDNSNQGQGRGVERILSITKAESLVLPSSVKSCLCCVYMRYEPGRVTSDFLNHELEEITCQVKVSLSEYRFGILNAIRLAQVQFDRLPRGKASFPNIVIFLCMRSREPRQRWLKEMLELRDAHRLSISQILDISRTEWDLFFDKNLDSRYPSKRLNYGLTKDTIPWEAHHTNMVKVQQQLRDEKTVREVLEERLGKAQSFPL